jgi:hypothetical protein
MAPRKQAKKKTAKKASKGPKKFGVFDHVNAIKTIQDPNHFDKLSDEEAKTWSTWMIHRALSMNEDYLPVINEIQVFWELKPEHMYKVLIEIIPKRKTFDKFINGKKENKFEEWLVDLVKKDLVVSTKEANDYLNIFMLTDQGKEALRSLCLRYSVDEKEIKKLKL